jgi:hypothetical protein
MIWKLISLKKSTFDNVGFEETYGDLNLVLQKHLWDIEFDKWSQKNWLCEKTMLRAKKRKKRKKDNNFKIDKISMNFNLWWYSVW